MSLIIRGDSENKNGLALGKGFKITRSKARIIHDTNGIIGDPKKPGRREDADFRSALQLVIDAKPKIIVLHQGPIGAEQQRGEEQVTKLITQASDVLTICGHVHWKQPLANLHPTHQVINVDSRVVVLTVSK